LTYQRFAFVILVWLEDEMMGGKVKRSSFCLSIPTAQDIIDLLRSKLAKYAVTRTLSRGAARSLNVPLQRVSHPYVRVVPLLPSWKLSGFPQQT
jgi:hypothetical protein